jgi:hypothetical protein
MRYVLAALAMLCLLTVGNAQAYIINGDDDGPTFTHNGSLMRMVNLPYGRGIEIRYEECRGRCWSEADGRGRSDQRT